MKEGGKMIKCRAMECTSMRMERHIKDNGKTISNMERVNMNFQMELFT